MWPRRYRGWGGSGIKNGRLLALIEGHFDVFITGDKRLELEDASATFLNVLRDTQAAESDHLLAAELARDLVAINDELVGALLTVLRNDVESETLRAMAEGSLGVDDDED